MIDRIRAELVQAARSLVATPGPVAAAVLTLTITVGVNLAMFGLIGRALLSPPAHVADPGRVFTLGFLREGDTPDAGAMTTSSFVTFASIRDQVPTLAGAAAFERDQTSAVIDGEQRQVNAMLITSTYFDVLGTRPALGPGIQPARNEAAATDPVVVLSDAFWHSAFGGDRGVIGRRINIRGVEYAVSGVMPAGFSGHSSTDVDLWVPIAAAMHDSPGWDHDAFRNIVSTVVRLSPTANVAAAEAQAHAAIGRPVHLSAIAGAEVAATEQRVAWWLGGVSLLVLVIGLANAATLLIVRAARRRHDLAIRAALGASREQLLVHAFAEALVLAFAATAASLLLAPTLDDAVRRVLFPGVIASAGISRTTLMAASLAGMVAMFVAAAANVWHLPFDVHPGDLGASARAGTRRMRTMRTLLVVQTTLSVLLLTGAGMFASSFYKLASQDFGMRMDGVIVVGFEPGPMPVRDESALFENALDQVRAMPGVQMATVIDGLPFGGHNIPPISVPGRAEPPAVGQQLPFLNAATPEFMTILGVQIVEGRTFTAADDKGAPVVVVNQAMARGVWPGESAVGKCIRIGFDPDFDPATAAGPPVPSAAVTCREVIGVAKDVRQRSLLPGDHEAELMQYYVPFSQVPQPPFLPAHEPHVHGLLIRAGANAAALPAAIRRLIVAQRTELPYLQVRPYMQLLDRQMRPWTLGTTLLGWFSLLAIGVAAVGLYAAFSHAVAERRREMAIRLAIGAEPGGILRMVLRESLTLACAGIACGSLAAVLSGRWLQSLLFETTTADPTVLASAAMVMLVVAAGATLLPARAASRVNPNSLLRVQ